MSIKILKYKLNDNHWKVIKPFLIFLNHIEPTDFIHIEMDANIVQRLREI